MTTERIDAYRIGWTRRFVPARLWLCFLRGRQPDGRRVSRSAYARRIWSYIRRWLVNPKDWLRQPWQAEAEGQRFARRGLTPAAAERKMRRDVEHEMLTGRRSLYQRYRWWRARRWDRANLPSGGGR
ncbi:hypothetical protein O7626_40590 [Micromonospora sp. WMMD1102]|uniref:hypothetical protein n=1 Tax=Micromonospora sp. WMMD1102 TaxID=3016105 RepID=UPI002415786A|nr:hypothetical protein [Micromonospora sp. WMMD1102]MDG4792116.1 hypothetical protein [Micromonospora sp. WMMD1102]